MGWKRDKVEAISLRYVTTQKIALGVLKRMGSGGVMAGNFALLPLREAAPVNKARADR